MHPTWRPWWSSLCAKQFFSMAFNYQLHDFVVHGLMAFDEILLHLDRGKNYKLNSFRLGPYVSFYPAKYVQDIVEGSCKDAHYIGKEHYAYVKGRCLATHNQYKNPSLPSILRYGSFEWCSACSLSSLSCEKAKLWWSYMWYKTAYWKDREQ